jgi:hypothetical protein
MAQCNVKHTRNQEVMSQIQSENFYHIKDWPLVVHYCEEHSLRIKHYKLKLVKTIPPSQTFHLSLSPTQSANPHYLDRPPENVMRNHGNSKHKRNHFFSIPIYFKARRYGFILCLHTVNKQTF